MSGPREAILGVLGDGGLSEPAVAAELGVLLPERGDPVRRLLDAGARHRDASGRSRADPPRVLCNRGANGIDGTVSTAFGAAAARSSAARSCC